MDMNKTPGMGRMDRKKEETKQKIIRVAMKLFLQHGVDAITMEQIATEVDIAKGTLYNYFPVKEAILSDYIQQTFVERNPERSQRLQRLPDTRTRLVVMLSELMTGVQAQKDLFEKYHIYRTKKMISFQQDEGSETGISLLSTQIITLGQQAGEIRTDLPMEILLDLFEFAFIEVARLFYLAPDRFNASLAIDQCVDLFLNGARS